MNATDKATQVIHQPELHRFVVVVSDNEATLSYHLTDKTVDFSNTFVPTELRGQGIAEKLVRRGLDWAKTEQLNIEASCSYVQKFIR